MTDVERTKAIAKEAAKLYARDLMKELGIKASYFGDNDRPLDKHHLESLKNMIINLEISMNLGGCLE